MKGLRQEQMLLKQSVMLRHLPKLFTLLLVALCGACTTPQIPLPPPNTDGFTMSVRQTEQQIRVQGKANLAGGTIYFEDPTGRGVFAPLDGNGNFDTGWFTAPDGQTLRIRVGDGDNSSDPICAAVDYGAQKLRQTTCP